MWQKILHARWLIAVLALLVIIAGRAVFNVYGKYQAGRANLALTEKELAAVMEKKSALEKETTKLQTEQGIEEEIRKKYQVTKENERLIIILNEQPQNLSEETLKNSGGLWSFIRKFFDFKRN